MAGPHQDNGVPWTISTPVNTGTPNFRPPSQPSPVTTPVNTGTPNFGGQGTGGANQRPLPPIIDTSLDNDPTVEEVWAHTGGQQPDTYIPPEEYYSDVFGGEGTDWINVSKIGGGLNNPGSALYGMDPETLAQWGITPKQEFIPQDLAQMIMEGSWVSGNEAVQNASLAPIITEDMTSGEKEAARQKAIQSGWEPNIGTWGDIEAGTHPLFPGGLDDYYKVMGQNWGVTNQGGGGGWTPERNLLDDRRAWQEQLWYGPKQSPQKEMREQGFFDTMEDAYSEDIAETLDKGLYSGTFIHPGAGILPWGMEKKWATGRAKGGIVSLVGG